MGARPRGHITCLSPPTALLSSERQVTRTEVLRSVLSASEDLKRERTCGSVDQLGLDAVDQLPQRDVEPARYLLLLEGRDVVRDLGDDVASQLSGLLGIHVSGQAEEKRTRVQVGELLVAINVAEHESRHGLGLEDG